MRLLSAAFVSLRIWLECVFSPLDIITSGLREFKSSGSIAGVVRIWISTFFDRYNHYSLLNRVGIKWNNVVYYLPSVFIVILAVIANGIGSHALLKIFGLSSDIYETTIRYTIVLVYTPITTLVAVPSALRNFFAIHEIRMENKDDLYEFIQRVIAHGFLGRVDPVTLGTAIAYTTGFIGVLTLAAFAECVCQWYLNARFRTYIAVGITSFVAAIIYRWVEIPLQSFLVYSVVTTPHGDAESKKVVASPVYRPPISPSASGAGRRGCPDQVQRLSG
jgi:hypothetical protein